MLPPSLHLSVVVRQCSKGLAVTRGSAEPYCTFDLRSSAWWLLDYKPGHPVPGFPFEALECCSCCCWCFFFGQVMQRYLGFQRF